jgi:triphosphoribosyl-dephospho-CoA synthetase
MHGAGARPRPAVATPSFAEGVASLAVRSLLREAEAAPKPGLVDRLGSGAHADMDIRHFRASACALGPYFRALAQAGLDLSPAGEYLDERDAQRLRELGLAAERAMLKATGGVNTHKGAIWSLGLLSAAAGRLIQRRRTPRRGPAGLSAEALCDEASKLASALVGVAAPPAKRLSNGRLGVLLYGLRSAQDEALQAFPSIRASALHLARGQRHAASGDTYAAAGPEAIPLHRFPVGEEDNLVIMVLLSIMAHADDTCVAARGGIQALTGMRAAARAILAAARQDGERAWAAYRALLREFSRKRLSPGGSADLCAATLFLVDLEGYPLSFNPARNGAAQRAKRAIAR